MRHRKKLNHLGRTSSHRKAMLANMASSLILHKRITTTVAKAKALRVYVEPLITKSKTDSTHSRRMVFSYLKNKYAVSELFREVSPKIAERPGGYTRILKTSTRLGDSAEMCIIELVDYNENMLSVQKETKTASKRSRRGRGKKSPSGSEATPAAGQVKEKAEKEVKTEEIPEKAAEKKEDSPVSETIKESAEKVKEEKPAAEKTEKEQATEKKVEESAEEVKEEKPVADKKEEEKPSDENDDPSDAKKSE